MKRKWKVMKEAEVGFNGAERQELEKDWKMLAGSLKGKKPKGQKEWDAAKEWFAKNGKKADESSEVECDGCGRIVHDDDVEIVGDQVLCYNCRRGSVNESGPTIRKKIDGKTVKEWYEWLKKENMGCCHLSVGQTAKNDICICMGWHDDGEDGEIAWKIGEQSFRNAMQTDLDVDFDMPYDPKTGDVYDTLSYLDDVDPETFDWNRLADEMNRTAQEVYEYACEVDGIDDDDLYEESWLGDKMKAGWGKVKQGAKNLANKIGKALNGPFEKGEHITMKGEDGQEFRGTIKYWDRGDKTYEVMLGKQVANEDWDGRGTQEDVFEMPDRVDELEANIERLWNELGPIDDKSKIIMELISNYVELEKIEPGRVDFEESTLVNEETREEIAYLKSIGEYDDYKKMVRALKAKNAKKKSTKKPAKRKWGGASKKSARKPISRPAEKKYKYSFSASGYGTKTYSFPSEEECLKEMKQDAEATAEDYGGEVQWWDDKECVVIDGDGQELGTFVYLGARR